MKEVRPCWTLATKVYAILYLLMFCLPLLLLLRASSRPYLTGIPSNGWTLSNYHALASQRPFWTALQNTIVFGVAMSVIATSVALASVLAGSCLRSGVLRKVTFLFIGIVFFCGLIPRIFALEFLLSGQGPFVNLWKTVMGGSTSGLLYTRVGLILAYLAAMLPVSITTLALSRREIAPDYVDAASDLGSSWLRTQIQVVLPLMRPGIIVSCILSFIFVAGDVVIVDLIGGSQFYTLAAQVLDYAKIDDWGTAAAIGSLFALTLFTAIGWSLAIVTKQTR